MQTSFSPIRLALAAVASLLFVAPPMQAAHYRHIPVIHTFTFQVASNAVVAVGTNHSASLGDLMIGDRVSVAFEQQGDTLVARRIGKGILPKAHSPNGNPTPAPHHPKAASALAHTQGVIQAIDVEGGTLTVVARRVHPSP
jgi:hypothetical protein